MKYVVRIFISLLFILSCGSDDSVDEGTSVSYPAVESKFSGRIDLDQLYNYANQEVPDYITKKNISTNLITDRGATLGRVLFYDKELSSDRTVACATCHNQSLAFSDSDVQSEGVNGVTGRHSMRLVNNRFAEEVRFFWDERAATLMEQVTMPIRDHGEMGFSGMDGDPNFQDLIDRLSALDYYQELFTFVYGDSEITENRIQQSLAQFVSSIQSFDSKYDTGRAQANTEEEDFVNFTEDENRGKSLFLGTPQFDGNSNRVFGGLGCAGCHRPPEFDIDPNSQNNGVILDLTGGFDFTNTKAPSLRDLVGPEGTSNSGLMHTGGFVGIQQVLTHYNIVNEVQGNDNLDERLNPFGQGQRLNITNQEASQVIAFLRTLTGSNLYTDPKWSDPF